MLYEKPRTRDRRMDNYYKERHNRKDQERNTQGGKLQELAYDRGDKKEKIECNRAY